MRVNNVEIVQALIEALQQGDVDAVRAATVPDLEWHAADDEPEAGAHVGVEAVPFEFRGKPRGSTTEVTIEETHVYRLRGCKVVEVRVYRALKATLEASTEY
jgi:ketosteroid isomerase-like protein